MRNEKTLAVLFAFVAVEVIAVMICAALVIASWREVDIQKQEILQKSDTILKQRMLILDLMRGDKVDLDSEF